MLPMDLRSYREKQGSVEEVARQLKLTGGYLSQLERGLKWPGPYIIKKIGDWSGGRVTAQDIFDSLDMSLFRRKPTRKGSGRKARGD